MRAWVVLAVLLWASPAQAATGEWTGTLRGSSTTLTTRQSGSISSTSRVVYRAVATFRLAVAGNRVSGTGDGKYLQATWHLQGTNGSAGTFSCSPHLAAKPFHVTIRGQANGSTLSLTLRLPDAFESNANLDCGAGYTAYGGKTHDLADSLARATAKGVTHAGVFTAHSDKTTAAGFHKVTDDRWVLTLER